MSGPVDDRIPSFAYMAEQAGVVEIGPQLRARWRRELISDLRFWLGKFEALCGEPEWTHERMEAVYTIGWVARQMYFIDEADRLAGASYDGAAEEVTELMQRLAANL